MYNYLVHHPDVNKGRFIEPKEFMEEIVSNCDMNYEIMFVLNNPDKITYHHFSNIELLESADEYERGSVLWWVRFLNFGIPIILIPFVIHEMAPEQIKYISWPLL